MDDLAEVGFLPLGVGGSFGFLSCAVGWCIAGIEGLQAVFAYRESGCFYHFLLLVADLLKLIRVAGRRAEG